MDWAQRRVGRRSVFRAADYVRRTGQARHADLHRPGAGSADGRHRDRHAWNQQPKQRGQHWVADIGIEGKKIKHEGKLTDAYYFCLGGAVGQHAAVARTVGYRCPAPLAPEAIERLLRQYLADRIPNENLRAWFGRHSDDELRAHLAGEVLAAVERDAPAGPVPHGVAD